MTQKKYDTNYLKDEDEDDVKKSERRNSKRFDERLHAKFGKDICTVLNVSAKGVLLQTKMPEYFFPLEEEVSFDLQLESGEWMEIFATVMWVQCDIENSKIGLNIERAPEPYFDFLRTIYE